MPFAQERRAITRRFEAVRHRRLPRREPAVRSGVRAHVDLVPEPLLIAARKQSGSCRAAMRASHIGIRESSALPGQRVDVRRRNVPASMHAYVGISHVVADDHHDVRRTRLSQRLTGGGKGDGERDSQNHKPRPGASHIPLPFRSPSTPLGGYNGCRATLLESIAWPRQAEKRSIVVPGVSITHRFVQNCLSQIDGEGRIRARTAVTGGHDEEQSDDGAHCDADGELGWAVAAANSRLRRRRPPSQHAVPASRSR